MWRVLPAAFSKSRKARLALSATFSSVSEETPYNIAHGELSRASRVPAQSVRPPESSKNSQPFLAFSESQEEFIEMFRIDQRLDGHSPIFKAWRVNRKNVDAIRENRSSIV